jgi:hypothetical protein
MRPVVTPQSNIADLYVPALSDRALRCALDELASDKPANRLSAVKFLGECGSLLPGYHSAISRALVRENNPEVLVALLELLGRERSLAERMVPLMVRALRYDASGSRAVWDVRSAATKVLASLGDLAQAAYVPLWISHFTALGRGLDLPEVFANHMPGRTRLFTESYREHVDTFLGKSREEKSESLLGCSLYGLERQEHVRAFLLCALCDPDEGVRQSAVRVVRRHRMDYIPDGVRLAFESAMAFASEYYIKPGMSGNNRLGFAINCLPFKGSESLALILANGVGGIPPIDVIQQMARAAEISPRGVAEECLSEIAEYLQSPDTDVARYAARTLGDVSRTLQEPFRNKVLMEIMSALDNAWNLAEPRQEDFGELPKVLGYANGDHGLVVRYCGQMLAIRQGPLVEWVAASILVRRLPNITEPDLVEKAQGILEYLRKSENDDVQVLLRDRSLQYLSGIPKPRSQ